MTDSSTTLAMNWQVVAKKAKAVAEAEYRIEGVKGLVLRTRATGAAAFYVCYHVRQDGARKFRRLKLDFDPTVQGALGLAAKRAVEIMMAVATGADPAAEKQAERVAEAKPKGTTFRELFELRLASDPSIKDSTKLGYRVAVSVTPGGAPSVMDQIGDLPAHEITPQQIVGVLDRIEARGSLVQADRTRAAISSTFRWAMKRHSVQSNPCAGLGKRSQSVPRKRVLSSQELCTFWRGLDHPDLWMSAAMKLIVRLALLTGQRRAEIAGARVSELQLDGASPLWTVPGDTMARGKTAKLIRGRTKNSKEQVVPLSRQAVTLWREALALARGSEYAFPSRLDVVKVGREPRHPHFDPRSVSKAVARARGAIGIEDVTPHDLRRTMATWAGDAGIRPDVIDRILNHRPRDVTRLHYNHSTLEPMVRQAMQSWADHVEAVASDQGHEAGNVVAFKPAVA